MAERDVPDWIKNIYPAGVPEHRAEEMRTIGALLGRFESIGLTCRFGFVQRAYSCELSSLFRWAGMQIDDVISGLDCGWSFLDDRSKMRLEYRPDLGHFLVIVAGKIIFHSAEEDANANTDALAAALARRHGFLVRKLMNDIKTSEKYFCLFIKNETSELAKVDEVLKRLVSFNPANKLLVVHPVSDRERFGKISVASQNLVYGFNREKDDCVTDGFIFPDWIGICQQADAYWRNAEEPVGQFTVPVHARKTLTGVVS